MINKIDAHFHIDYCDFDVFKTLKYMDANKIERCWLLSWEEINPGRWHYVHLPVENIYDAFTEYSDRFIPLYAPDPDDINCLKKFEFWKEKGIRGCGELKVTLNWRSDKMVSILNYLEKNKLPLVFHMEEPEFRYIRYETAGIIDRVLLRMELSSGMDRLSNRIIDFIAKIMPNIKNRIRYWFPGYLMDISALEFVLEKYKKIIFIGHGPYIWKNISSDAMFTTDKYPATKIEKEGYLIEMLRKHDNLFLDISGTSGFNAINRDKNFSKIFLEEFNEKILYGTDNEMSARQELLDSLSLTDKAYKNIYRNNAMSIINY